MKEIYIGLMSGTSADAVDAVAAAFTDKKIELLGTKSDRLPNDVKVKIKSLSNSDPIEIDELATLDNKLGLLFAKTTKELLKSLGLESDQVKAIGSHGQTIKHRPNDFMDGFSMQIGNASIIAVETGCQFFVVVSLSDSFLQRFHLNVDILSDKYFHVRLAHSYH